MCFAVDSAIWLAFDSLYAVSTDLTYSVGFLGAMYFSHRKNQNGGGTLIGNPRPVPLSEEREATIGGMGHLQPI